MQKDYRKEKPVTISPLRIESEHGKLSGYIYNNENREIHGNILFLLPLAEERKGTWRLYHETAVRLAEKSLCSILFDYAGTGESESDFNKINIGTIMSDINNACSTLGEKTASRKTTIISCRMSALFSFLAAKKYNLNIDRSIMIEPVCDGKKWIAEYERRSSFRGGGKIPRQNNKFKEIDGYAFNENFYSELSGLSTDNIINTVGIKHTIIQISHLEKPKDSYKILAEKLRRCDIECLKFPPFWLESGVVDYEIIIKSLEKHLLDMENRNYG